MTTYALIDLNSGFYWGAAEAPSPQAAAALVVAESDGSRPIRRYVSASRAEAVSRDGFAVHSVIDSQWSLEQDGQDPAVIAQVENFPLVGYVVPDQRDRGP